jgi:hypothetical protein
MEFKIETSKAIGFELARMALRIEEIRLSMTDGWEKEHLKRVRNDIAWLAGRLDGPELTL